MKFNIEIKGVFNLDKELIEDLNYQNLTQEEIIKKETKYYKGVLTTEYEFQKTGLEVKITPFTKKKKQEKK